MNANLSHLLERRSVAARLLEPPGPSEQELERLLTIAARVPDHGKLVPWRFLVIEGDARFRIGKVIAEAFRADQPDARADQFSVEETRLARAPLVVGVVSRARPHPKIPEWEQILSAGAVCMNLLNAATAMGFGANWITEWYAYDRRVLDALGLEPFERIAGFVHIGSFSEPRTDRPRPALSEVVTRL
ncbi:nitroreductase family protein [Microvirga massiliensis]|uniref:nitroreductase family protein n=1 Tax=Microvirga massiliensis TaxID=1033741 RepID=UPI00062BEFB3|nr:nitroreductase [Microvirga massiliensis]